MKTLFLLVLLTRNGAGDINAAFVNTETRAECEDKAMMLQEVFSSANIPTVASRCIASKLRFSAFSHASSSSLPRHFYVIRFDHEVVRIQEMPDWKSCMTTQRQEAGQGQGQVYCSSSIQSLEP